MKYQCPKCKTNTRFYQLSDTRIKCSRCRIRISPNKGRLRIDYGIARKVISEFVLEHSTEIILSRVKISKNKLLKFLTLLRIVMTTAIPKAFEGIVEVDETYLGGKWINKRKHVKLRQKSKRGRGTSKQPVFGILCRSGQVWAELIEGVEAEDLQPRIEKQVKKGSTICSDTWRGYTGIAAKGYVHRLVNHGKHEYSDRKGNHINGLEGFWGYLKRKMAAKGGIRKSRLHLYLGEYVWRYNHKLLSLKEQENMLNKLIFKHIWSEN